MCARPRRRLREARAEIIVGKHGTSHRPDLGARQACLAVAPQRVGTGRVDDHIEVCREEAFQIAGVRRAAPREDPADTQSRHRRDMVQNRAADASRLPPRDSVVAVQVRDEPHDAVGDAADAGGGRDAPVDALSGAEHAAADLDHGQRLRLREGRERGGAHGPRQAAARAVGGQGGGVLTNWIEWVARAEGRAVQATSVAGVSQRTGATIYYLEIGPEGAQAPIFSLAPAAGDVDVIAITDSQLVNLAGNVSVPGFLEPQGGFGFESGSGGGAAASAAPALSNGRRTSTGRHRRIIVYYVRVIERHIFKP